MTTDWSYNAREVQIFHADMKRAEQGTLTERKEAAQAFYRAMASDPAVVAERIGWMLDGNYGAGAYSQARQVLQRPRMNREAWLVQVIGALEWMCPVRAGVQAWKKLSPDQKSRLAIGVRREIASALKDMSEPSRDRRRPRASARRSRVRSGRRQARRR